MMARAQNLKKHNKILGFEISENNLFCVEIHFVKNNINIVNAFRLDMPIFQDLNQTITLIKQHLRALKIKTKDAAFGFSMQYFKLFPVPIPKTIPYDEIDSIILQEGNVNSSTDLAVWIPLNNTQRQDPDGVTRYDVLGMSLPNTLVDAGKLIASKCGLNIVSLTPAFLNLGILLDSKASNKLISTVWVSQIRTEFIVWSGQEPIYEHLFLTLQFNDQLFQSVNFIQSQLSGTEISTVYLLGPFVNNVNFSGLPFNFQQFTLNPIYLDVSGVFQKFRLNEIIGSLATAVSGSNYLTYFVPNFLNPINILHKPFETIFKQAKSQGVKQPVTLPFGKKLDPLIGRFIYFSIAILLFSFLAYFFIQSILMPNVLANQAGFQSRITLAQAHLTKVLNFEKTNSVLNLKIDFFSDLIEKRKPWSKILKEIGDMTPKGLWIDRLEIRGANIDVFGRAINVDAIANFSINLNYTAKLLNRAQIIALKKFQEEGFDIIEFQISVKVKELINSLSDKAEKTLLKKESKV